ncbi:MAG: TolC family protein [Chlorobium sp.]|nr:MAG: TolC family protein [Chlorobium sp.]
MLVFRLFLSLCIVGLLFASPSFGKDSEAPEKQLSLANCIEIALKNASSAKKAENNFKLQGADVLRSYGSFLPRISASAGYSPYTLSRTYSAVNNPVSDINKTTLRTVDLTLSTSLNLFNGFSDYASLQSSLSKEHAAEYNLGRALQSIVYDVTQSYFQVLLDRELYEISRENLLLAQDQLTLTERQFNVGLKSMTDRFQQQADTEQSRLSVIKAETRMNRSLLELIRRLRIDPQTKITIIPDPDELKVPVVAKPDIDSLLTVALQQRLDLKSKSLETNAAQWQIRSARAAWYPSIDLNFSLSSGGLEYLNHEYLYPPLSEQLRNTVGYSAGINLSWTIFDRFQTRYSVSAAKINHLNQQLDYEDLKNNIAIDLRQAAGEYASAFDQIATATVSFTAARSAFDAVKRKYELGAASFVELSAARATLFNAHSNLSQATYNLALQKNILDFTTGKIATQP